MLKDTWVDKVDNVDDVMAEDINMIAEAVIALEEEFQILPSAEATRFPVEVEEDAV